MNRIFNFQNRTFFTVQFLFLALLFSSSACHAVSVTAEKNAPENEKQESGNSSKNPAAPGKTKPTVAAVSIDEIIGRYKLDTYRAGKGGNKNYLTIKKIGAAKINVYWEGLNYFMAGKNETFHEASAEGNLPIKGVTAAGKLLEEGSESPCAITLTFARDKITLKTSACNINVSPDGVYQRTEDEDEIVPDEDEDAPEKTANQNEATAFVEYNESGAPIAILNMMGTEEVRKGCEDEVKTFAGKLLKITGYGDSSSSYDFTLAGSRRERETFSIQFCKEDKITAEDINNIFKTGANLTVKYLYCGNAPIFSPTEIRVN